MNKDYQTTLDYLYRQLPMFQRVGKQAFKKDLGNILRLSEALGNPHRQLRCIHLAGTNGKGSTAHILSAIFQSAGYKTGLYTSPHYRDFRERIKIDGQLISQDWVVGFVGQHRHLFEEIQPSFFEITVAMAFLYFAQQEVDIAIIETGLGGRLDSTNIITPLISIITNISFDHQAMLGDTLPLIAREKAGIIKPGVPVLIGERHEETTAVFDEVAKAKNAPIHYAEEQIEVVLNRHLPFHTVFDIQSNETAELLDLSVNLKGAFQQANLRTALSALGLLRKYSLLETPITEVAIRKGLEDLQSISYFIGRWQKINETPLTICDSAHNEGGLRIVFRQLAEMEFDQLHFVFGTVNDKDLKTILPLFPPSATYYFCKADIPRGLAADRLQAEAHGFGLEGQAYSSVEEALQAAQSQANESDLIFVGGSIFVVAEVLEEIRS